MINFEEKTAYTVEDLRRIVHLLRAPGGCPWDGAQTHESIRRNFLEEAYEVAEAIDEKNPAHLKEELGDVLLQVLFHASIEEDAGRFTLDDVADGICKKLVERHPHLFGGEKKDWEEIKREKGGVTSAAAHAAAVPRCLPALMRAKKVQKRLGLAMFSSKSPENAVCALKSAVERLDKGGQNCDNVKEELGDVLFAAVAVGRQSGIDCEELLAETCDRYIQADSEREAGQ